MAGAQASLFSKMQANLYGSPDDVTRILSSLVSGQSVATALGGFLDAADPRALEALGGVASGAKDIAKAVAERIAERREPEGSEPESYLDRGERDLDLDLAGE